MTETMFDRLLVPWREPALLWRSLVHLLVGMPIGALACTVVLTLLATAAGLAVTFVLAVPVAWLTFVAARGISHVERSRAAALLGIHLEDPVPHLTAPSWWRRLLERFTTRARWREIAHHVLLLPTTLATFVGAYVAWCGSLALVTLPLYVSSLPGGTAKFGLFEVGIGPAAIAFAAVGAAGLAVAAPWATLTLARLQVGLTRRFLGRTERDVLAEQVRQVEGRRAAAVDSAEAERRRIERDLHDGAQQRLVALAAELGAAKEKLATDPEAGRAMVASAHDEAKAALKEIRDLVRGIHPVILEDRGLDAALSAVVARAPVPVALDVRVDPRPSATTESAAYFVVNEALTNIARHAQATRAHVTIARAGDRLVVEVRDDGIGGADASRGSGLQGLRERVDSLGGDLRVISPAGGPTTISVELPCAS